MPALADILATLRVVSIPTRTTFRGVTTREAALFEGPNGWTEFSPFIEYDDEEAATWLRAALEYGWDETPRPLRHRIEVNATVPAVSAMEVPGVLERFPGCTTVKVKVAEHGQTISDDIARVRAVRRALGSRGKIRIDANGGWMPVEALTAISTLSPYDIEYIEQPCADIRDMAWLRRELQGEMRIAADESLRKADDPLLVADAQAADLLIVKGQPLGGISRALDIIRQAGLPVIVSSALDTSIGISMGAHLAAALPDHLRGGACGLGTVALLRGDVTTESLLPRSGGIAVKRVSAERLLLDRYRAPSYRETWWRDRITRCFNLIHDESLA